MDEAAIALVRRTWDAFARGDVHAVLEVLHPHVHWHGAGEADSEGACHSRQDAEAFIRALLHDGVSAELLDVRAVGDRVVALVQMHHGAEPNDRPPPHGELITVRDGRITEMLSYPTVEDAVTAPASRAPGKGS